MTPTFWVAVSASVVGLAGVVVAVWQLTKILRSVRISEQANTLSAVAHCANRHEMLISQMPADDDSTWWYRYWDLFTEEFTFFRKSLLDCDVFELWIAELATVYHERPRPKLRERAESHREYLTGTLPSYTALHDFFRELDLISRVPDSTLRGKRVHELIVQFAPPEARFDISVGGTGEASSHLRQRLSTEATGRESNATAA